MYAVIRAGGKQYRVAPGDVIEIEKLPQTSGENVQFDDVLAVSATEGEIAKPAAAFVSGQVVEHGRGDKVLVFHYKRKKQYKKLQGHRQDLHRGEDYRHQRGRTGAESVMLLCQFMVVVLSAVKRFDAVVLHAWSSVREMVRSIRGFGSDGEADLRMKSVRY